MSPRAAWRLEDRGFGPVYDYVPGKMDWLAADLPYEGAADLVGAHTRRAAARVVAEDTVGAARAAIDSAGFGPALVLNPAGVLVAALHEKDLADAPVDAAVAERAAFGTSTVRPSEQVEPLLQRMTAAGVTRVVVTRSDGTLVGLFFAADAGHEHG